MPRPNSRRPSVAAEPLLHRQALLTASIKICNVCWYARAAEQTHVRYTHLVVDPYRIGRAR